MKALLASLMLILLFSGAVLADEGGGPLTVRVDCAHLRQALDMHPRPLTVEFSGTCTQDVTIPGDDITLRGADSSATVVGTVNLIGRSRVTLEGFTVRDTTRPPSPATRLGDGIIILNGQNIELTQMKIINAGNTGIAMEGSSVKLTNCEVADPRFLAIGVALGSVVHVAGTLTVTGSDGNAVMVTDGGQIQFQGGSNTVITDNAGTGLFIQLKGYVFLHGGSRVTSMRNGFGISVVDHGNIVYASRITVANNVGFGVQVGQLADWTVVAGTTPTLSVTDNGGPGFLISRQAFVRLRENTTITGNAGPGIVVDGAGLAVRGSTIQNNNNGHGDVVLVFGTNATFDGGNTFGTPLTCDSTVLVRGQFACGAPVQ